MAVPGRSLIGLLKRHHLWIPLLPLAMALTLALVGQAHIITANALGSQGIAVNAMVLNATTADQTNANGTHATRYRLLLHFLPTHGDAVETWHDVGLEVFETATVGEILRLRYLPDDPAIFEVTDGRTRQSGQAFLLAGAVFGLIGLGLVYVFGRQVPSARRAQLSKQRRPAVVQAHENTGIKLGDVHLHRMIWMDNLHDTGRSRARKPGNLPAIGQTITLRIDPKTAGSWWEGDL